MVVPGKSPSGSIFIGRHHHQRIYSSLTRATWKNVVLARIPGLLEPPLVESNSSEFWTECDIYMREGGEESTCDCLPSK